MTVSGSHLVLALALRFLDATAMAQALGDAKCGGLLASRALTGCDVTSPFAGKGKCTAWTAWYAYDDATSAMCTLSRMPTTESVTNVLPIIKRLTVIMYDRGSSESSVNGERLVLFPQQVKEIENIPPTQDALAQHVLRVGYEAGHVWDQATIKAPQFPSPADFGWTWEVANAQWNMKWMTLPLHLLVPRAVQPSNVDAPMDAEVSTSARRQTLRAQCSGIRKCLFCCAKVWWMLIRQLVHVAYGHV